MTSKPQIAVTLGDPAGIGPEIILKALADSRLRENCQITVIGSRKILQETYNQLQGFSADLVNPKDFTIFNLEGDEKWGKIRTGEGNVSSGAASFAYLEEAINQTLAGKFHAIVTAPIAKTYWKAAGYDYPGQTELLAKKANVKRFGMLFVARSPHSGWMFRTLLATTHIPLSQVPTALTPEVLSLKLELLIECLNQDFGIKNPKIAVAGLNPHSGENGQLGTEEKEWLNAWLQQERQRYPNFKIDGLIPPDTLWVKPGQAWQGSAQNAHDAYLALYHDQGLIPVKLMAFDQAVNTTIGLPFIRTSPDHGTAFDIAGKGVASASSMKAALQLAVELATQRLKGRVID